MPIYSNFNRLFPFGNAPLVLVNLRNWRCAASMALVGARRILPLLLLGSDGPAVLWWRHEPLVDFRPSGLCPDRKDCAGWTFSGPRR